jgi:hypothetical protein
MGVFATTKEKDYNRIGLFLISRISPLPPYLERKFVGFIVLSCNRALRKRWMIITYNIVA